MSWTLFKGADMAQILNHLGTDFVSCSAQRFGEVTSGPGRYRSREGLSQNELDELTSAFRSADLGRSWKILAAGHVTIVADFGHWEAI
jgi:hypothetical protein